MEKLIEYIMKPGYEYHGCMGHPPDDLDPDCQCCNDLRPILDIEERLTELLGELEILENNAVLKKDIGPSRVAVIRQRELHAILYKRKEPQDGS